ncbi:hypothetical protein FGB62_261g05 [Gracilaria domingensis]|nr:hypothetical protein FGB62_261g05 [Gracilaria domingensis]
MSASDFSSSEAAELVLKERQRQRDLHSSKSRAAPNGAPVTQAAPPALETVSTPQWSHAAHANVDEAELDRRHRPPPAEGPRRTQGAGAAHSRRDYGDSTQVGTRQSRGDVVGGECQHAARGAARQGEAAGTHAEEQAGYGRSAH